MKFEVKKSAIHGKGVFTTGFTPKNTKLTLVADKDIITLIARLRDTRTIFGKYINHSDHANSTWFHDDGIWYAKTTQPLSPNTEVTINYNVGPWFVAKHTI